MFNRHGLDLKKVAHSPLLMPKRPRTLIIQAMMLYSSRVTLDKLSMIPINNPIIVNCLFSLLYILKHFWNKVHIEVANASLVSWIRSPLPFWFNSLLFLFLISCTFRFTLIAKALGVIIILIIFFSPLP